MVETDKHLTYKTWWKQTNILHTKNSGNRQTSYTQNMVETDKHLTYKTWWKQTNILHTKHGGNRQTSYIQNTVETDKHEHAEIDRFITSNSCMHIPPLLSMLKSSISLDKNRLAVSNTSTSTGNTMDGLDIWLVLMRMKEV